MLHITSEKKTREKIFEAFGNSTKMAKMAKMAMSHKSFFGHFGHFGHLGDPVSWRALGRLLAH
jgi:hypothetical protein